MSPSSVDTEPLEMRGGLAGALAPFAVFLSGVAWLALAGAPDERGFWPVLLASLAVGLVLARDRPRYSEALLDGMAQRLVMLMVVAWLLAGVLSTLLAASGFVDGLVWVASRAGVGAGGYVALTFVLCGLMSTSTGTSFGTILIAGPLLYPAGAATSADPVALIGAVLGGATFGDSISPISDTTIASAGTQGADVGGTVRARLKYVLPAALVALVVFGVTGGAGTEGAGAAASGIAARPDGLIMAIVPALIIALLFARRHLVEALLFGTIAAVVVGLTSGLLEPAQLLRVEPGQFAARSLIIDGLERGVGVSIFTLLLVALVAALEATGTLKRLAARADTRSGSPKTAEAWIVGVVSGAVLLTTHSVVAVLAVGPFARDAGARVGLSAYRRANLLDMTVCTWPFLLPYFLPTILSSNATASGAAVGMPRVSPLDAGLANAYSWALLTVIVVAVASGYGRREGVAPDAAAGRI
ncbi:MAG: Na+/H+ antiporter NhaC family protein [Acidobacteriota bacterium]